MKRGVLVRPNLRIFLLGALLLVVLQDVLMHGNSQTTIVVSARSNCPPPKDYSLSELLAQANTAPTPDLLMRLSDEYEQRGDLKKALFFLRRAERLADQTGSF